MNALTHASYRPRIPRYYICIHRNAVNDMNIDPDYPATNPPPTPTAVIPSASPVITGRSRHPTHPTVAWWGWGRCGGSPGGMMTGQNIM